MHHYRAKQQEANQHYFHVTSPWLVSKCLYGETSPVESIERGRAGRQVFPVEAFCDVPSQNNRSRRSEGRSRRTDVLVSGFLCIYRSFSHHKPQIPMGAKPSVLRFADLRSLTSDLFRGVQKRCCLYSSPSLLCRIAPQRARLKGGACLRRFRFARGWLAKP
jgi:hypothetical protein